MNKCSKHPRYKGIKPPKCQCKECVLFYMNKQGMYRVLDNGWGMSNILYNYAQQKKQMTEDDVQYFQRKVREWDHDYNVFRENMKSK